MAESDQAYVYVMVNHAMPGWIKVGFTERDVERRRQELSSATGVMEPFKVAHVFGVPFGTAAEAERLAHGALRTFTRKKEFFRCTPDQAIHLLEAALAKLSGASCIDVPATRKVVETAWKSRKATFEELSNLRVAYEAEKAASDTAFYKRRRDMEAEFAQRFASRLLANRVAAFVTVGIICAVAWHVIHPLLAVALVFPLGLFWIPLTVLRVLPVSADDLPQFKVAEMELGMKHDALLNQLESRFRDQEASVQARAEAYYSEQRAAEDMLKSFNLSPRFKDS